MLIFSCSDIERAGLPKFATEGADGGSVQRVEAQLGKQNVQIQELVGALQVGKSLSEQRQEELQETLQAQMLEEMRRLEDEKLVLQGKVEALHEVNDRTLDLLTRLGLME